MKLEIASARLPQLDKNNCGSAVNTAVNSSLRTRRLSTFALGWFLLGLILIADQTGFAQIKKENSRAAGNPAYKILVFTKTTGFRHDSIPAAIAAVQNLAAQNGFRVDATEDAAAFNAANLTQYRAVIFLLTTGNLLNLEQRQAFENYIRSGKGFVGVHSASDTEYDWAWYGGLVGARFLNHPQIQTATVRVENRNHVSTAGLPANWTRTDEWYNFGTNPRGNVTVLANLDESTYTGGSMNGDHPIAWFHSYDGGRAWYTGGGHTTESYSESLFRGHLLGGIHYAVNLPQTAATAQISGRVVRQNNSGIAGARVVLQNATTGATRFAITSVGGRFVFRNVALNDLYIIKASRKNVQFGEPQHTAQLLGDRDDLIFMSSDR